MQRVPGGLEMQMEYVVVRAKRSSQWRANVGPGLGLGPPGRAEY